MDEPAKPGERLDASFLERFNYLASSGTLEDLEGLRRENRELEMLVNDAAILLAREGVESIIEYAMGRLLERFVPSRLVFILQPPRGRLRQYGYRTMRRVEEELPSAYFTALSAFFRDSPHPAGFDELEAALGAATFGADFRALEPRLILPMLGIGGLFGVVILGARLVGGDYGAAERIYIDRLVRFLSVAVQNRLHHESAITDAKTGLFVHDYFMRRLDEEAARIGRHGGRSGVIMVDVDHFKLFNDRHGHLAGDAVLAAAARIMRATIRVEDVASRFGGEEFCVLAIDCENGGRGSLLEVAERLRTAIAAMKVDFGGEALSVTVSLGCCYLDPARGRGPEKTLAMADRALYLSKDGGRNRSTIVGGGLFDRALGRLGSGASADGGAAARRTESPNAPRSAPRSGEGSADGR